MGTEQISVDISQVEYGTGEAVLRGDLDTEVSLGCAMWQEPLMRKLLC